MRTPEEVYHDFSMRRKGILRALTSEYGPRLVDLSSTIVVGSVLPSEKASTSSQNSIMGSHSAF